MIGLSGVFLEKIMKKLDFCDKWIHLVMSCVKTVNYLFCLIEFRLTTSFQNVD